MSETRVDNTSTSSSTESFSQFLEAASKGDLEKLKELQKNIQDINLYDKEGNSALHLAGQNGKIEVLKYLLECEKISIDIKNNLGQTPLLVSYKHLDCVKTLLDKGAFKDQRDNDGNTILHYVSKEGLETQTLELIRRTVNVKLTNKENKTPLHLAIENNKNDVAMILTSNGADISLRYQLEGSKKHHLSPEEEEEEIKKVAQRDDLGFLKESDNANNSSSSKKLEKAKKHKLELELSRSQKWAKMITDWDEFATKHNKKLESRVYKGIPERVRFQAWQYLSGSLKLEEKNKGKYQEYLNQFSKDSEQIDLDVNRSYRNHIQFNERFGTGQISLFNILKAYSNYDKEVGYCQGMSDMTAFILMNVSEEETFWLLVALLNDTKYNLHGRFLSGFPLLYQSFWIWEQLLQKKESSVWKHLQKLEITTQYYAFRWFLLIFLDSLPFNLTLRVWDVFLFKGYDIVYSVALTIIKMFSSEIVKLSFENLMSFFKGIEKKNIDEEEFIKQVRENEIPPKKLRKLELKYATKDQENPKSKSRKGSKITKSEGRSRNGSAPPPKPSSLSKRSKNKKGSLPSEFTNSTQTN